MARNSSVGLVALGLLVAAAGCFGGAGKNGQVANAAPAPPKLTFDGDAAMKDLEKQVAFGPRVPNMASHDACRDYLVDTLKPLADSVERQDFTWTVGTRTLKMTNVIARFKGTGGRKGALLSAHWDTRPTADYERLPADRLKPIPGANDGASGVAVLLQAARMFKKTPPPVPVMIVFFDGEDYGPGVDRMFLGSRHFADHQPEGTPRRGILLDMIGDKDLQVPKEENSVNAAQDVVDEVYGTARSLGLEKYFPGVVDKPIEDDHIPLQQRGLKIIDLIDFDYGPDHTWWHTLADTPDKCSAHSLAVVGEVVTHWVYSRK